MAHSHNLRLEPHAKTHQSATIAAWGKRLGIQALTVSSVSMAEYFAKNGWEDLTLAFPVNIRSMDRINALAQKIRLGLFVNSLASAEALATGLEAAVDCTLEIDTGYHRSGVDHRDTSQIKRLVERIRSAEKLRFRGFYCHAGHSYGSRSEADILATHEDTQGKLLELKRLIPEAEIAIGDTPCCAVADDFSGIQTIRPGNFIFYDLMQAQIGSCREEDIAVALAAPVVEVHPERKQLVVHGGAVHLSKDFLHDEKGRPYFGRVVRLQPRGWGAALEGVYLRSLSQEHGIVEWSDQQLDEVRVGDVLGILPIHSCLTANLMGAYLTLDGEMVEMG
jgi:D-serine deaminase-like pyridoxal phosphate-dependent protein